MKNNNVSYIVIWIFSYTSFLPSFVTFENITKEAYKLFCSLYDWHLPVRALGVSVCDFYDGNVQLDLFGGLNQKSRELDKTILKIKNKFGNESISTGNSLKDTYLGQPLGGLHSYQNSKNDKKLT